CFQRARAIAASRALAEALIFRRGLRPIPFTLAHRAFCAARILAIAAALIFLLTGAPAVAVLDVPSTLASSASRASILSLRPAACRSCFADRFTIVFIAAVSVPLPGSQDLGCPKIRVALVMSRTYPALSLLYQCLELGMFAFNHILH